MATKEENIARLQELAVQLGRDPDISGSAAEISQRVAEWEEEVGGMPDGENAETTASDPQDEPGAVKSSLHSSGFVLIRAVRTLHIHALAADSDRVLETVPAGEPARIPARYVDELAGDGLIVAL
ncbi:DNA breaking-rejoining protein [Salmonella enterica]|uniref:DNA breaking-rejoining protein n=1 Tax=Salmonella enterica TaxID=28901 RepID=A0A5T2M4H9_SALER|nr:DNA-packaging protein FI [Salmonella enterica]ATI90363.1 DNA breaking-rejoining protein [Salmonella enterica subsp. enterica]EAA8034717.1 DNA breaking-rejoining protein [Salmonella enterica subsp. enterica serovar Duisburg]EBL5122716.1 DNA breaking-rejoining protein [Salmonella enterica subsp. enterica serovar Rubislaw]ECH8181620.1 DNA breaking-rejoining protein [Salmonella enterica subsp. enterica serovar Rissen]ECS6418878.1 DNA breaking-rejoining protein [Salmonella enterica subsp. diariz